MEANRLKIKDIIQNINYLQIKQNVFQKRPYKMGVFMTNTPK